MRFLVYSPVDEGTLKEKLGTAEYSYFFVMRGFLPVLSELGDVVHITDPDREADALFDEATAAGEDCRLVCFCPPNRAPVGLRCPTTAVVAWEFDSVPSIPWDGEPRNDWRTVLADHGNVITLSQHTADVVRATMGQDFPVTAMPVPVFDQLAVVHDGGKDPIAHGSIRFRGRLIDSGAVDYLGDEVELRDPLAFCRETYDGSQRTFKFAEGEVGPEFLLGFYNPEVWGAWSRSEGPAVLLPFALTGRVRFSILAAGHGYNVGRTVTVSVGGSSHDITLGAEPTRYEFTLDVREPSNLVRFTGIDAREFPGTMDTRTMGMGLMEVSVRRAGVMGRLRRRGGRDDRGSDPAAGSPVPVAAAEQVVQLDGIIYTSVLNPEDGRKNWHDLVSAFIHAHRTHDDATLVLKLTHRTAETLVGDMLTDLRVNGRMACRVVAVHGFLPDEDLARLMTCTTYYANASKAEGLCLPVMEFMSAGVPAVAPDHTAMADYVTSANTFIVNSFIEPTAWPADPQRRLTTSYHRIDWESLSEQFAASYAVAKEDPDRYREMSTEAVATQRRYSADTPVAQRLALHLQAVAAQGVPA